MKLEKLEKGKRFFEENLQLKLEIFPGIFFLKVVFLKHFLPVAVISYVDTYPIEVFHIFWLGLQFELV